MLLLIFVAFAFSTFEFRRLSVCAIDHCGSGCLDLFPYSRPSRASACPPCGSRSPTYVIRTAVPLFVRPDGVRVTSPRRTSTLPHAPGPACGRWCLLRAACRAVCRRGITEDRTPTHQVPSLDVNSAGSHTLLLGARDSALLLVSRQRQRLAVDEELEHHLAARLGVRRDRQNLLLTRRARLGAGAL